MKTAYATDEHLLRIYKHIARGATPADRAPWMAKLARLDPELFSWTAKNRPWFHAGQ